MKSSDVLELIRAGFTKEEILAMNDDQAPVLPAEVSGPDVKDPEEIKEPEPIEAPEMKPDNMYHQMLSQMQNMLNDGLNRIQQANMTAASMPDVHPETPEDLIAKIIAPEVKSK